MKYQAYKNKYLRSTKVLAGLYAIRQKIRIKNTFADIVYNGLVVEKSCKNIKKFI